MRRGRLAVIAMACVMAMMSCSPKVLPYDVVRTVVEYRDRVQHDSVWQHDSVYLKIQGDTIMKEVYRDRYRDRNVYVHDTVTRTDTVRVPQPYPVEVERELTRWEQMKMDVGGWAIAVAVLMIVGMMAKYILRNR